MKGSAENNEVMPLSKSEVLQISFIIKYTPIAEVLNCAKYMLDK